MDRLATTPRNRASVRRSFSGAKTVWLIQIVLVCVVFTPVVVLAVGGGHESMAHSERQALGAQMREQSRSADGAESPAATRAISKAMRFVERAERGDKPDEHFDRALKLFAKAIKHHPHNPNAYTGLARAYVGLGRYQDALDACDASFALQTTNFLVTRLRGEALMGLNRTDDARFVYDALQRAGETQHLERLRTVMSNWMMNAQQSTNADPVELERFARWFGESTGVAP